MAYNGSMMSTKEQGPDPFYRTAREELMDLFSDLYKDVYGFRPRYEWHGTDDDLRNEIADLSAELEVVLEEEDTREQENYAAWKMRMDDYCKNFTISMATAIRWDMAAEKCANDLDVDYYCYKLGISYDHAAEIREILKEGNS